MRRAGPNVRVPGRWGRPDIRVAGRLLEGGEGRAQPLADLPRVVVLPLEHGQRLRDVLDHVVLLSNLALEENRSSQGSGRFKQSKALDRNNFLMVTIEEIGST